MGLFILLLCVLHLLFRATFQTPKAYFFPFSNQLVNCFQSNSLAGSPHRRPSVRDEVCLVLSDKAISSGCKKPVVTVWSSWRSGGPLWNCSRQHQLWNVWFHDYWARWWKKWRKFALFSLKKTNKKKTRWTRKREVKWRVVELDGGSRLWAASATNTNVGLNGTKRKTWESVLMPHLFDTSVS